MEKYISNITKSNNINEKFIASNSGVNGKRVFISKNYVIKFFPDSKKKYYPNELFIYSKLDSKYRSKLISFGEIDEYNYIVMTKSRGKTLYSIWEELTNSEREKCVKQIAEILKKIAQLSKTAKIDFRKEIENSYFQAINNISLSQKTLNRVKKFFLENISYISNEEIGYLTYIDVHFDNFLYNKGKIKAIDFEALKVAPLDYQMDRWCRMSRHPKVYANGNDKAIIQEENYIGIVELMKKYYPEAFNYEAEKNRLHIYSLVYNLNVIKKHNIPESEMQKLLEEDMLL